MTFPLASPKLWTEGKYIDFWSIIHILSGILLGILLNLLGMNFWPALFTVIILAILFEIIEFFVLGIETFQNKVIDVIILIPCFIFAFFILPKSLVLFLIILTVSIILHIFGWTVILFLDGKIYKRIKNKFLRNLYKFFYKKRKSFK